MTFYGYPTSVCSVEYEAFFPKADVVQSFAYSSSNTVNALKTIPQSVKCRYEMLDMPHYFWRFHQIFTAKKGFIF